MLNMRRKEPDMDEQVIKRDDVVFTSLVLKDGNLEEKENMTLKIYFQKSFLTLLYCSHRCSYYTYLKILLNKVNELVTDITYEWEK